MSRSNKEHWNKVYSSNSEQQLGWYEDSPTLSLELIEKCSINKNDPILDVGSGATTLIDFLVNQNYRRIIALDISEVALEKLRSRLSVEKASQVQWLIDDITKPTSILELKDIAIWHDRALLHFLIEEKQRQVYLSVLKKVIRDGGYAIIATFAKSGASQCSGLNVKRYDHESLAAFLGDEFELKESVEFEYQMPSGAIRPYVYGRFQKKKS
jgi:ubiquinone/menaquinone biosynthesis C-methylase UbiE